MRHLCRTATAWVTGLAEPGTTEERLATPGSELTAHTLHALLDGLALQAFYYPGHTEPERIRQTLSVHLDEMARTAPR